MDSGEANALLTALEGDHRTAALPPSDLAMLDYAAKLTCTPKALTAGDIASLRGAGFDDRAIHDICAITGYFAFVNRIADGLGVELEARFSR
jgi:uncharacterized peroxidase-related enzyme